MKWLPDARCIAARQMLLVGFFTGILCGCSDSANREQSPVESLVSVETDWDSAAPRIKAVARSTAAAR